MTKKITIEPKKLRQWLKAAYISGAGEGIEMTERALEGEDIETKKEIEDAFTEWVKENVGPSD